MASKKPPLSQNRSGLTDKQIQFIEQYLIDFNATQAAIRCGYSKKTAKEQASRLLTKVNIQHELSKRFTDKANKVGISRERTMEEIGRIAFSDIRRFFDANGNLKALSDLDDESAAVLSSMEVDELFDGYGEDRQQVGVTKKVRLWDKLKALEMLAKHFKIYSDAPLTNQTVKFGYGPEQPV